MRTPRWLTTARIGTALAVTGAMVAGTLAALPAGAATDTVTVTYRGVSVTVPASWPELWDWNRDILAAGLRGEGRVSQFAFAAAAERCAGSRRRCCRCRAC